MTAMAPKRKPDQWSELVYLDFLAGPGLGIDRKSGAEFDGSPLRALRVTPAFDRLVFSDVQSQNVDALKQRIPAADRSRVDVRLGDCHDVARDVVAKLSQRTLGLAFVDPEGFEVQFRLFQTLAARRIDVLYLFPGGIGIARNVGAFVKRAKAPLDDLIPGWRDLRRARVVAGQKLTTEEMASYDQPFVMAFRQRMGQARISVFRTGRAVLHEREEREDVPPAVLFETPRGLGPMARRDTGRGKRPAPALLRRERYSV